MRAVPFIETSTPLSAHDAAASRTLQHPAPDRQSNIADAMMISSAHQRTDSRTRTVAQCANDCLSDGMMAAILLLITLATRRTSAHRKSNAAD